MKSLWKKIASFFEHPVVAGTSAGLLTLLIWNKVDERSFQKVKLMFKDFLTTKIALPVWVIILATVILVLIIRIRRYILYRRQHIAPKNPVLNEKIGSYTFEELHGILANEKLRIRTEKMKDLLIPPPDESLLTQFINKYEDFSKGIPVGDRNILIALGTISSEDGGYTAEILIPKLLEYDLLVVEKKDHTIQGRGRSFTVSTFYLSETGYKFFDCLKKLKQAQSR